MRVPLHADGAIVGVHDGLANREAQAHAVGFGRVERLEHPRQLLVCESDAKVGNRHRHGAFERTRAQPDPLGGRLLVLERLERVEQQVEDDLLQLDTVAEDTWKIGGEIDIDRYAAGRDIALQDLDHVVDAVVQVDAGVFGGVFTQQRAQAAHDFGRALIVGDDVGECRSQLEEVGHRQRRGAAAPPAHWS